MTDSRAFCPRCGDSIETPLEVREARRGDAALCDDCYFEEFELIDAPDRVQVLVCATCGAVHRGNRWIDIGAEDYTDVAIDEVTQALAVHIDVDEFSWQVEPEQVDETTIRMHCYFTGLVGEEPVEEQVTVPVKISRQTCQRCGRISGDYYASIVQLRGVDRMPTAEEISRTKEIANEVVAEMEATGDRDAFVTEMTENDDGLNIRLSTNKIGMKVSQRVVDEFGGSFTDAETLVTEDEDGNEVYRVTYAIRLPPYRPGHVIDPKDDDEGPVLVTSARGNLKGTYLTTGERYEASYEDGDSPDARRLGTIEDGEETTLVTVEDDHAVQVLDPETYRAKTIARPDYLDPDAETVTVLKSRAGLHVLPEDGRGQQSKDE